MRAFSNSRAAAADAGLAAPLAILTTALMATLITAFAAPSAAQAGDAPKTVAVDAQLLATDPSELTPVEEAAILAAYRKRLAQEIAAQGPQAERDGARALRVLEAEATGATPQTGFYLCTVFGAIDDYAGRPGVSLYRSGAFSCVIDSSGGGLRLRKTSGSPLDLPLAEPAPGLLTFESRYHSGLVKPTRRWVVDTLGPQTLRIMPFEPAMPAELASEDAPLTGADINIIFLSLQ